MKTYNHENGKTYQLIQTTECDHNFACIGCDLNPDNLDVINASCNCGCDSGSSTPFKICAPANNDGKDMILKEIKPKQHIRQNVLTICAANATYKIDKDLQQISSYVVYRRNFKGDEFGASFSSFENAFNLVQELLKVHDEHLVLFTQKYINQNF